MTLTPSDVDTVLATVLADDVRAELQRADTLPAPVFDADYVEVPWMLDDGRRFQSVTISGKVRDGKIVCFACEDSFGDPVPFPAEHRTEADADLLAAAREMSS